MAHHLDSPIARQDIRLDITDLFVFRGEIGTVFVIDVCHSIAGAIPNPGYHPEGMYEFKVDLDGDAIEDLTYRITFDERDPAGKQRYALRRISGAEAADPNAAGLIVAQGTTGDTVITTAGIRIWAGKADDPFWIEPDVLHAVGHAFQDGTIVELGHGRQTKQRIRSPVTRSTQSFWKFRTRSCSRMPTLTVISVFGLWRHSRPMRGGGVRSTGWGCQ